MARRVAVGEAAVLLMTVWDEDGNATSADGAVTVSVEDVDGLVVATGTATLTPDGIYKFPVPTEASDAIDTYTAVWSYTLDGFAQTYTTRFEVVGGHYFEVADLRGFNLSVDENPGRYTASKIREARDTACERFEKECALSFVPRRTRSTVKGKNRRLLILPWNAIREVFGITVDGVAFTLAELDLITVRDFGIEMPPGLSWDSDTTFYVDYLHGLDAPETPVVRAVKMLAVDYLVPSSVPSRARSESTELGTVSFTLAGRDGATGIPEVDATIVAYGRNTVTVP